jgi:hypothetical protein
MPSFLPTLLLFPLNFHAGPRQTQIERTERLNGYYPKRDSLHMVTHIPEGSLYRKHIPDFVQYEATPLSNQRHYRPYPPHP